MKRLWENVLKVKAQVIACMLIIVASFSLSFIAALGGISESGQVLVNKVTDIALVGAIAWLFTMSKQEDKEENK